MSLIPESHIDLLERPIVCSLATVMPDGQPQVTPVWFNYDGEHVLVNTARGRQKDRNMELRRKVTVLVVDPENPYRWMEIRGTVTEIDEANGVAHIDELARRYTNRDQYYTSEELRAKETRAMYKVRVDRVNTSR